MAETRRLAELDAAGKLKAEQVPDDVGQVQSVDGQVGHVSLSGTYTTPAQLTAALDALLDGAPGALDTLRELAAAIGDDADFAGTVTAMVAAKADASDLVDEATTRAAADSALADLLTAEQTTRANADTALGVRIDDAETAIAGKADVTALDGLATETYVDAAVASGTSQAGTLAARPAASADNAGQFYVATDVNGGTLYRSNGTSWVQAGAPVEVITTVVKSADETISNSATAQNDDHLFGAVEAGAIYEVDLFLLYNSTTTADLKVGFTAPTGSTLVWHALGNQVGGSSSSSASIRIDAGALFDTRALGGTGAANLVAHLTGLLIVGATAGTFRFQWAQQTAEVSDTKVLANSFLKLRKL